MAETATTPHTTDDVSGLLAIARQQGERDVYAGKRGWIRYTLGMRTEVTTDPTIPFASWPVTTHNVSGGGVGFWSKRALEIGTPIHILDLTDKSAPVWIPAKVMHCTVGIRGYLLGAQFDVPSAPDDPSMFVAAARLSSDDPGVTEADVSGPRLPPLGRLCALTSMGTGLACGLVAAVAQGLAGGVLGTALAGIAAFVVAGLVGRSGGNWVARRCIGFLCVLRESLLALAIGRTVQDDLPNVEVRELAAVRSAFLDLQARARRREEGERIQRQKLEEVNQMKSNLIAIVSHDLRTPLTSILLYARMLGEDLETLPTEDQRNFLKIISDECTRLSRLVDDLLEVQRLESDRVQWNLQTQDLSEVIRASASVFDAMAKSKSIELTVKCPQRLPPVVADADKMSQVLSNLMSNAIKYTQAGGKVEVSAIAHGQQMLLRVTDNGPGIHRDMWDSIFDRFSQIRDPDVSDIAGVGLGLYIVKKIVEGHGGAVWVDSEVGVGSKFYISLPVRDDNRPPTPPKVVKEGEAYRVLVCDPDPQLAAVLGQTLRQHGYDVRTAHSGRRLLAHLAHGDVDVVITDVLLSDMSAGQLLEGIQSMNELAFKLIVHSYAEDGKELRHPGIDLFVQRPIPQDVLVNRIQDLTRGSAPAAGRAKLAAAAAGARKSARPAGVGVAPSPPPMERQP